MENILSYRFDEYTNMVKSFHGSDAPGVLIGGFMVGLAYQHLPEGGLYEVICETAKCLPDSVQLLTRCTLGNQRIMVIDIGRFALTFYEKWTGIGVRVYIDCSKLDNWSEIKKWFLKLCLKKNQDSAILMSQIKEAGTDICAVQDILVIIDSLKKETKDQFYCDLPVMWRSISFN